MDRYLERLGGALYLEKVEDVERYRDATAHLNVDSSPPDATADQLTRIVREI